ncbi:Uncharacterized protein CK203_089029 [Vitis vinifera]|uniref:Hydroxyproline-rich glycoprotein family protein n=1 Tax=Vitis vinifera TaxID=29760 RepID=A0A438BQV3_VITVI|nr:Uncharacterized protein CK203_089029 [Vitis vinifera]
MESGLLGVSALPTKGNSSVFQARSADLTKNQKNVAGMMIDESCGLTGNLMMMMELRKKVMTFRDIIGFPPYDEAGPINELVIGTVEDLHKLYPIVVPHTLTLDMKEVSLYQGLVHLYNVLKSVGDSWANNHKWIADFGCDAEGSLENFSLGQLGRRVLAKLDYMIKIAREMFDIMDEDKRNNEERTEDSNIGDILGESYSDNKVTYPSPNSPTLELSISMIYFPPILSPVRLQAAGNIANKSIATVTNEQKEQATAPPLPPSPPSNLPLNGAAPPPPPPLAVAKALRPRKANNKLKRSTHMGNLYRTLKGKVEGSSLQGKNSQGRTSAIGDSAGGKQGMADALAEMTKRSAYFQQIEEDVQKHGKVIMEIKVAISSFQTKDMDELLKFQKHVEQHLEELTDETQVLARFEDFPMKKLETLRMAAALYLKLRGIATDLQNWKVAPPLRQLLDKVESYFNKIKRELDALERTKDEESKRFQSHNIHFDFNILMRIKESMVDVSSSCMELALQERRQAKAAANAETGSKTKGMTKACAKMLWKAFQLAFRVYTFAGGQDDRADNLTKELAQEIENEPEHK